VKGYDPKQKADQRFKKKDGMKEITWCEMVMRYATTCDKIILFWAYFGTICVAVVRPGFSLAFGLVVDGVGETASAGAVKDVSEVGFE
jgi:ATP-binding cassette subfamily B (MDR/TAP) protein 1